MPGLLLPLMLVGCGPTKEQEVTRQVLVRAQTARAGVSHLVMRYGQHREPAGSGPDAPDRVWDGGAGFRDSQEGRTARTLLSEYSKPVLVDPAFERGKEIEEVSVATAELVDLSLEPGGEWAPFVEEIGRARARLDRAVTALETGTKGFILIEARTETNKTTSAYADAIAAARAADAGTQEGASPPQ